MFSLTNLCKNTRLCARTLKSAKCTVKGLAFLNFNLSYEHITGETFVKENTEDIAARIEKNVTEWLTK